MSVSRVDVLALAALAKYVEQEGDGRGFDDDVTEDDMRAVLEALDGAETALLYETLWPSVDA